jgi:hypothetical protein
MDGVDPFVIGNAFQSSVGNALVDKSLLDVASGFGVRELAPAFGCASLLALGRKRRQAAALQKLTLAFR